MARPNYLLAGNCPEGKRPDGTDCGIGGYVAVHLPVSAQTGANVVEIEEMQKTNRQLNDEVEKLRTQVEKMGPRRIKEEDKMSMAEELKVAGSFPVRVSYLFDVEFTYVSDWFDVFKRADWQLEAKTIPVDFGQPGWLPSPGLLLLVRDWNRAPWNPGFVPEGVRIVGEVFTRHRVQFTLQPSGNADPNVIEIIVGRRS